MLDDLNNNGVLKGIVTNRDLRFERNNDRIITEVMTSKNLVVTSEGTSLKQAEGILQKNKIEKLPVVDTDNKLIAGAFRLRWEPIFIKWVSKMQRGFVKGRSMRRRHRLRCSDD